MTLMHRGFMLLVGILGAAAGFHQVAAAKPNIVLFIADDLSYADCGLAHGAAGPAPHLSRLAGEGMTFTHVLAASPSCAPSRAALLTGLAPLRNGSMFNHQPPSADIKKLPAYLRELGYEVVAFGKVAHYSQGRNYGFDLVARDTFHDDRCVDAAVDWLKQRRDARPLCMLVGTNWPHVPWPEAEQGVDPQTPLPPTQVDTPQTREYRAGYMAAVRQMDADLQKTYDAAYLALGRDTLFIFISDQGAQWPFGKWNLYDAGLRVPMVAVWPGVVSPGSVDGELTSLLDVLPTLVEVAGGQAPAELDGQSLAPALAGRPHHGRKFVFATHSGDGSMNRYPMRAVRSQRFKYIRNLDPNAEFTSHITLGKPVDGRTYWESWLAMASRDAGAAAIVQRHQRRPAEELYDLAEDPHEQRNRASEPEFAEELQEMRAALDQWMKRQGDQGLATEQEIAGAFYSAPRQ